MIINEIFELITKLFDPGCIKQVKNKVTRRVTFQPYLPSQNADFSNDGFNFYDYLLMLDNIDGGTLPDMLHTLSDYIKVTKVGTKT